MHHPRRANPEIKQLVAEASRALAVLDATRLEELALSCQALNRELDSAANPARRDFARQAVDSARDMAVFARVLEATRANVAVIQRIRALRRGHPLDYGAQSEARYGDN